MALTVLAKGKTDEEGELEQEKKGGGGGDGDSNDGFDRVVEEEELAVVDIVVCRTFAKTMASRVAVLCSLVR